MKRKYDARLWSLLSSDNSKEEEEVDQKAAGQQELVEGVLRWNKDVTVNELLEGSCDEEERTPETMKNDTRRRTGGR
jgi:hypothetical protein